MRHPGTPREAAEGETLSGTERSMRGRSRLGALKRGLVVLSPCRTRPVLVVETTCILCSGVLDLCGVPFFCPRGRTKKRPSLFNNS